MLTSLVFVPLSDKQLRLIIKVVYFFTGWKAQIILGVSQTLQEIKHSFLKNTKL